MIESIARSKNLSAKHKMGYKNLMFFVNNSRTRVQRVKTGTRLSSVLDLQLQESKEVIFILNLAITNN